MLPYDAVIFDLDGTLTDSAPGIRACACYALEKMGFPIPDGHVLQRFLGPPLADSFMRWCGMTEEQAARATDLYRERYIPIGWKENRVYPRIRALLHALKRQGAYLAVATGKPQHTSEDILRYFGLLPCLDAVAGPSPEDLHADKGDLIRRVLPAGRRAVMVGDTAGDIRGAQDAGIDSIAALYGYGADEEVLAQGPTLAVPDENALCALLCPGMPVPRGAAVSLEGVSSDWAAALTERLEAFGYAVRTAREPEAALAAAAGGAIALCPESVRGALRLDAFLPGNADAPEDRERVLSALCRRLTEMEVL